MRYQVVHYMIFRPLEPKNVGWLSALLVLPPAVPAAMLIITMSSPVLALALGYSTYYLSIMLSATVYRLSPRHPLALYPGPLPCKVTKLWMVYQANTGKLHEYIRGLHATHGSIVRIG